MATKLDWAIIPNKANVTFVIPQDFHYYDLYNVTNQEAIRYGERSWGINLVWCDPAKSDNIRFQRQRRSNSPIVFEEPIAIHVRRGGFLVYQSSRNGINLGCSDQPKYEWEIRDGQAGAEVKPGLTIGLCNRVEKDLLMYEVRDVGINLKWFKDAGKHKSLSSAIGMAKDAAPYFITLGRFVAG